ncbi:MAG: YkgJ family cysteine cluster protein [Deltaproteobacteria bacterium]
MNPTLKEQALACIFSWHEKWSRIFPLACRGGCSSCCTRSVTMTGLEGTILRNYLEQESKIGQLQELPVLAAGDARPQSTTNQFAAACLQGIETAGEPAGWNFTPCPFLVDHHCTIYPVRPFSCRAFASLAPCHLSGAADAPSLLLTVNTILCQLIEHLDQGGLWGNMLDVLPALSETGANTQGELLTCQPCPGLLIPPEEQEDLEELLARLFEEPIGSSTLGGLLGRGQEGP